MNEYDERMILAQRNIKALSDGLRHAEIKVNEHTGQIDRVLGQLTELQTQLQKLTIDLAVLKAGAVGRGPTT
jgi:predicted  nucleic acid-binding Zn-ribbon protein